MPEVAPDPKQRTKRDAPSRFQPDRRTRPTPMLSRFLFVGRRKGGRRDGERERIYVDRPVPWVMSSFVLVALLSVADAYFTLYELSLGATEANPVMRAALSLGNGGFVIVKTVITVVGAAFLGLHKNWAMGRACLWIAIAVYLALTAYHGWGMLHYLPASR